MPPNDFWSQAIASLVGAFGAFLLSIILFFITQSTRNRQKESASAANAASEIEVDVGMLEEIGTQIDDLCVEIDIETNKTKLYIPMRYAEALNHFISQAYAEGLLREILSPNEVTELNRLLSRSTQQTDDLNLFVLNQYKDGHSDKAETLRFFRNQKKQTGKDIKFLKDAKSRLKRLSEAKRPRVHIFNKGTLKS